MCQVPFRPHAPLPGTYYNSNFPKKNRGMERLRTLPEVTPQVPSATGRACTGSPEPAANSSDFVPMCYHRSAWSLCE